MALEGSPALIVLLGPTAAGKTSLAIEWAEPLNAEVVSADSVQVYRYMDIGTAKPAREIRGRVPHHLVDVADPDEGFSAARFQIEADRAIRDIHSRGKTALVVAGTGLYVRALTRGLFDGHGGDREVRERLREEARTRGTESLHGRLAQVDPDAAARIHPNDLFRVIRAIEVYLGTGLPISRHHATHGFAEERYRALYLGLDVERSVLHERIDARVEEMMSRGLVPEVDGLIRRGYGLDLPSMRALGYRHVGMYLRGHVSLEEAVLLLKRDTHRYARRQMTWFRAMSEVRWFPGRDSGMVLKESQRFLGKTVEHP